METKPKQVIYHDINFEKTNMKELISLCKKHKIKQYFNKIKVS